ncbi:MAG: cell division ATP-binding protein FtsE [Thermodesulfobacterium geofontis]|uniref:Cell division ATP-binding protein FtsE n=1 Tax=Thermodesulfobacterium geofontis TaxID=1295609 RepID=A0A2N7Q9G5_9BACT|nr:MAG: cell division ATP-binding protein FtsE [Thermodesulfobacterium geofontis]
MALITLQNVSKIYPPFFKALININLQIYKGDFIILTGPTGAGKTTLLKLIYKEEKPTSGELFYQNIPYSKLKPKELSFLRQNLGIIFQDYKLFPELTVYENIKISLILSKKFFKDAKLLIYEYLERFNISQKKVKELSGGEQQKVGIIRAIIRDPEILIADEPTGNLDPVSINEILSILKDFNKEGKTIILATHDPIILNQNLGKIVKLNKGELVEDV